MSDGAVPKGCRAFGASPRPRAFEMDCAALPRASFFVSFVGLLRFSLLAYTSRLSVFGPLCVRRRVVARAPCGSATCLSWQSYFRAACVDCVCVVAFVQARMIRLCFIVGFLSCFESVAAFEPRRIEIVGPAEPAVFDSVGVPAHPERGLQVFEVSELSLQSLAQHSEQGVEGVEFPSGRVHAPGVAIAYEVAAVNAFVAVWFHFVFFIRH